MDDSKKKAEAPDDDGCTYPGPDTPDPAPWLGQVGEGATEPSGERIAREIRRLLHPSADPEMPIPNPQKKK